MNQVLERIDKTRRGGRPPFGYDVDEDGFLYQVPTEYAKAQNFIREVKKSRAKKPTAEYFGIPQSAVQSILKRAEQNYEIPFDNEEWKVERAKVEAGEKELRPLDANNE